MSGFSKPSDFDSSHRQAFAQALVDVTSVLTDTSQVTLNVTQSASQRRRQMRARELTSSSSIDVTFSLEVDLSTHNFSIVNASSAAALVVADVVSDLQDSLNSTSNSSFMNSFLSAAESLNVSIANVSVDVSATSAALSTMADTVETTEVVYTRDPTPLPTAIPTHVPTPAPTATHHPSPSPSAAPTAEPTKEDKSSNSASVPFGVWVVVATFVALFGGFGLAWSLTQWQEWRAGARKIAPDSGPDRYKIHEPTKKSTRKAQVAVAPSMSADEIAAEERRIAQREKRLTKEHARSATVAPLPDVEAAPLPSITPAETPRQPIVAWPPSEESESQSEPQLPPRAIRNRGAAAEQVVQESSETQPLPLQEFRESQPLPLLPIPNAAAPSWSRAGGARLPALDSVPSSPNQRLDAPGSVTDFLQRPQNQPRRKFDRQGSSVV